MADRIVVMNAGNIEQVGRPLELYDNPQSMFVAEFIGSPSMNLLKGRFDKADGKAVFRLDANVVLPLAENFTAPEGSEAVYGIRPEYFTMGQFGGQSGEGVPAKVIVVEPLGPETQVTASIGDKTIVTVFRERISVEPDDTIWLLPQADRVCLFDTAGKRIN